MAPDDWRAEARTLASEATQRFFVPRELSELLPNYDALKASLPPKFSSLAAAFEKNISAVVATVSIPVTLALAAAQGSHWQRIHTAERIRALNLDAESGEDNSALEARRNSHALQSASQTMREFINSPDGRSRVAADACNFVLQALKSLNFDAAASELLLQGTVLTWSALEILCRDLFEAILNADPKRAIALMQEPTAKQRLQSKFTLEELAASGFNLASSLGSVLSAQQDFSDVRTIKAVLLPVVNSDPDSSTALGDKGVWILSQQRHLILHRRGVVDSTYLEATGEVKVIGDRLAVTPSELKSQVEAVVKAGRALLIAAGKHAV